MRDTKVLPAILVGLLLTPWIHGQEVSSRDQREAHQVELLRFVEAEFPEARIDVRTLNSSIVLSGHVTDPGHALTIVEMASDYYPKVINNLTVRPSQAKRQIKIVPLEKLRVESLLATVRQLFSDQLESKSLIADGTPKGNLLLLRGTPETLDPVLELIAEMENATPDPPSPGLWDPYTILQQRARHAEQSGEQMAMESLALQYRALAAEQQNAKDQEGARKQKDAVRQTLTQAVAQVFDRRQAEQQDLASQLEARLAKLQERLKQRTVHRDRHIEEAVDALLRGEPTSILGLVRQRSSLETNPGSQDASAANSFLTATQERINAEQAAKQALARAEEVAARAKEVAARDREAKLNSYRRELERLQLEVDRAASKVKFTRDEFRGMARANESATGTVTRSDLRKAEQAAEQAVFDLRRAELDLRAAQEQLESLQGSEN